MTQALEHVAAYSHSRIAGPSAAHLSPLSPFEPRGHRFSEYHRIKALTEPASRYGDLPFGASLAAAPANHSIAAPAVSAPGYRRTAAAKLVLDMSRGTRCVSRLEVRPHHAHEEAGILGVWLAKRARDPHLYDSFGCAAARHSVTRAAGGCDGAFEIMDDRTISVQHGGDELPGSSDHVTKWLRRSRVLIERMGWRRRRATAADVRRIRAALERPDVPPDSLHRYLERIRVVQLLLALEIGHYASTSARWSLAAGRTGKRSGENGNAGVISGLSKGAGHPSFLESADLSPRLALGTNTREIYSTFVRHADYATDLLTHTQSWT